MSQGPKNHGFSAFVALFLALVVVAIGQIFKESLAASRQGTLLAGGEALFALSFAVLASATIHRVAITTCILFSGIFLFFLNGISQTRYPIGQPIANAQIDKKKK